MKSYHLPARCVRHWLSISNQPDIDMASKEDSVPDGIFSLLDTDLYKLTMQCVVLKYFATDSEFVET